MCDPIEASFLVAKLQEGLCPRPEWHTIGIYNSLRLTICWFVLLEEVDSCNIPSTLRILVEERQQSIVELLKLQLRDPTLQSQEKHNILRLVATIAGDVPTVHLLLSMHSKQLRQKLQHLLKPHRTGV